MRIIALLLLLVSSHSFGQDITEEFDLIWENQVGITTFRTNIIHHNGKIIVGSNGKKSTLMNDDQDGVYVFQSDNGSRILRIDVLGIEVEDVNGVAAEGDRLYFGNDNGYFFCYSLEDYEKIWEYWIYSELPHDLIEELSADELELNDIESAPVLADLNADGKKDAIFTVEGLGLFALDGNSGEKIWSYISAYDHGSYMSSPAAYDLNSDGTKDFVFGGKEKDLMTGGWNYQNVIFAISGKTGLPIWKHNVHSNVHASPLIKVNRDSIEIYVAQSYSDVLVLDREGKMSRFINLNEFDGGISGLFSSPVLSDQNVLCIGTSWWGESDGVWTVPLCDDHFVQAADGLIEIEKSKRIFVPSGQVSASALVGDVLKSNKGNEIVIVSEKGEMLIYSSKGVLLKRLNMPAGTECTPLLANIDNDNKLELVITGNNGKIYAYKCKTKAKRKAIFWGQFKGNNSNTGVLKIK
jgi:outer membrane protein assembly factor BamB